MTIEDWLKNSGWKRYNNERYKQYNLN